MTLTRPRKIALGAVAGVLVLIGLGAALSGGDDAVTPANAAAPAATTVAPGGSPSAAATTPAPDPYAVYLASNPKPDLVLSREDAQTRARLGCGSAFAPGTVDAALAAAYRPGICG